MSTNNATCPPPPPLQGEKKGSMAGELLKAAGIQACDLKEYTAAGNAEASVLGGLAKADVTLTMNGTSSIGCESVIASANQFYQAQQNISCAISNSNASVSKTTNVSNNISITCGGNGIIDCPNFTIDQSIDFKMVDLSKLSNIDKQKITNHIKDAITNVSKDILNQTTHLGGSIQGGKTLRESLEDIQNLDYSNITNNSIQSVSIDTSNSNQTTIHFGGNLTLRGTNCTINQHIITNIVSTAILQNAMDAAFKNISDTINKNDSTTQQVYTAEGLAEVINKLKQDSMSGMITTIIGGVVAIAIIGVIGSMLMKGKGGTTGMSNPVEATKEHRKKMIIGGVVAVIVIILILLFVFHVI